MARKSFVQARPFAVLGMILLVWLFLPIVIKSWLNLSFFEMQAPAMTASSFLRDVQEYWSLRTRSKTELIEGILDLSRLNSTQELQLSETELLREEVARLEELLEIPPLAGYRYEVARVARRDMSAWWQQIFIRKGSAHGISIGDPVVFSRGVVGRVREVYANLAVVDLLSSEQLRIAAVIENDSRPVSYQGGINPPIQTPRGTVGFVPPDITLNPRPRLLTSGVGGVFPPGLLIGEIISLEASPDGLFQTGEVLLDADLNSVREVAVLVPLREENR